jgi:cytochrome-b5 reductase
MTFLIKHYNREGVADNVISKNVVESLMMTMPVYKISRKSHTKENVLLLAGGTGIAPMLQIMNYSQPNVNYIVIFSNTTIRDIIISQEIIKTRACLKIYSIISNKEDNFTANPINSLGEFDSYLVYSRVSTELIKQISKENKIDMFDFVYCCGPRDYMHDVCGNKNKDKTQGELSGFLKELGYDKDKVFKF